MSTIIENPSITATVSRRGRPRRQYRCEYCAKSFKRSEHCIRHERTHTQEKPFICRYCRKSYSRKDLVTRHERTLHADVHEQAQSRQRTQSDNQQEHQQATDRILDQVNVASLVPSQPSALGTPPEESIESLPEACESQNTPLTAFLGGSATQRDGAALSPSSTTSSSESNAAVEQGDEAPWSSPSVVAHENSEQEKRNSNRHSHVDVLSEVLGRQPIANMVDSFPDNETGLENRRQDDQSGNAPASPQLMPGDITDLMGTIDVMELDNTGMSTALDLHSNITTTLPDDGHNHPPLPGTLIHSTLSQDEALASYYFPMQNIDLDFSAFSFTPNSTQIDAMDANRLLSNLEANTAFQNSSNANFDPIMNAEHTLPTTVYGPQAVATASSHPSCQTRPTEPRKRDGDIPLLQRDKPQSTFTLSLDESGRAQLLHDLATRLDVIDAVNDIPSLKLCQGFLSSYVTSFHGHFPLVHLPSFCVSRTPSPLILAMCSIGALYRLDRRRARRYHDLASRAVVTVARPAPGEHSFVEEYCLWYVQTRTLLSFYAIMSGEQDLISKTMNENGFYTMVYNKTRTALTTDDVTSGRLTWDHWIQHESWKRLISGQFIISTLTMVLFDVNPGFNSTRDLNFDLIDDENMWDAASSAEWKELRARQSQQAGNRRRSMMEALFDIILQRHTRGDSAYHISTFSALVLMYAVVVHMWQRLQISHVFPQQAELSGHPDSSNHDLGPSLLDNAMQLMSRCEKFLQITENDHYPLESEGDSVTSLAFNCQAILRIARSMMFNTVRISLATFNPADMEASIVAFASATLHRGPQLLDAVSKCLQGLSIPVKIGHMLIRKTAAFRWSVEHAIAAWENALLVTKWIHSIELDKARGIEPTKLEQELLTLIMEVLEETECDVAASISLAAEVARTWGSFLQDVWVWDITPRMGKALEMVAQAYERANNKPRSSPLITQNAMISAGILAIHE